MYIYICSGLNKNNTLMCPLVLWFTDRLVHHSESHICCQSLRERRFTLKLRITAETTVKTLQKEHNPFFMWVISRKRVCLSLTCSKFKPLVPMGWRMLTLQIAQAMTFESLKIRANI